MFSDKEFVLSIMRQFGRDTAITVQANAPEMNGTALYEETNFIPDFIPACRVKNMKDREIGFVCKSSAGRVVRLIQPYNSDEHPQEPEQLEAHWAFVWSTNPDKALPFIALATSPYGIGECCIENGEVFRSKMAGNIWAPSAYPTAWEKIVN